MQEKTKATKINQDITIWNTRHIENLEGKLAIVTGGNGGIGVEVIFLQTFLKLIINIWKKWKIRVVLI